MSRVRSSAGSMTWGKMKFGSLVGECQRSAGWFILVAVLCGCVALFLQVAANFANDYSDGIRGTDEGRAVDSARSFAKTPSAESTSTRKCFRHRSPSMAPPSRRVRRESKKVLAAAGINALIACLCGLAVVTLTGYWWFILIGIACLVAGWCYVGGKHPYGYHYLGEIFVFIFFRARCHLRHDVRPGRHNLDRRHARRRQRRPHRRRGPVRQQPTRRRNRPHARQAHG